MTKDKVLPIGFEIDEKIATEIKTQLMDKMLPCASAHKIAQYFKVSPAFVGHTVDALEIRLSKCQLGLYGYPNKRGWEEARVTEMDIPEDFAQALRQKAADEKELTCLEVWKLAAKFGVLRKHAGYIADTLNLRIIKCQLGAF